MILRHLSAMRVRCCRRLPVLRRREASSRVDQRVEGRGRGVDHSRSALAAASSDAADAALGSTLSGTAQRQLAALIVAESVGSLSALERVVLNERRRPSAPTHVEVTDEAVRVQFDSAASPAYARLARSLRAPPATAAHLRPTAVENLSWCGGGAAVLFSRARLRSALLARAQLADGRADDRVVRALPAALDVDVIDMDIDNDIDIDIDIDSAGKRNSKGEAAAAETGGDQ